MIWNGDDFTATKSRFLRLVLSPLNPSQLEFMKDVWSCMVSTGRRDAASRRRERFWKLNTAASTCITAAPAAFVTVKSCPVPLIIFVTPNAVASGAQNRSSTTAVAAGAGAAIFADCLPLVTTR